MLIQVKWEHPGMFSFNDCGDKPIEHWSPLDASLLSQASPLQCRLFIYETLFQDLALIKHRAVFQFEQLLMGDSQGHANHHYAYLFRSSCLSLIFSHV